MIYSENMLHCNGIKTSAYMGVFNKRLQKSFEVKSRATNISDDMPESGGGGESSAAPEVAASEDDDGGSDDGEPARPRPHSKTSLKPGTASASKKHSAQSRIRQHTAEHSQEFKVIGLNEFDIAALIGMSVEFMRKDRSGKRLIPFYRIGTAIRYNPQRVFESLATLEEGGTQPKPRAKKSINALSAG